MSFLIKDVIFRVIDCLDAFVYPDYGDFVYLNPPYPSEKYPFRRYRRISNDMPDYFSFNKHSHLFNLITRLEFKNVLFLLHTSKISFVMKIFKDYYMGECKFKQGINIVSINPAKNEVIIFNKRSLVFKPH